MLINFDAANTPEEVAELASHIDSALLPESSKSLLVAYAAVKARAVRLRLAGDVRSAMAAESVCDQIYDLLPDAARW